jgi:hypothetical protein
MAVESWVLTLFASVLSVITGMLLFKVNRIAKKADERYKDSIAREVLYCSHRKDESVLLLEVAHAVEKGKCNGELDDAKRKFIATNQEYEKFVLTQAGMQLARNK